MKVKDYLEEKEVWFDEYDNNKESVKVYDEGSKGFYVEANSYDKRFKKKSELDSWLKKNKFKHIGSDKTHV